MAMQMQSLLASPMGSFANSSTKSELVNSSFRFPSWSSTTGRQMGLRVKCTAEEGPKSQSPSPSSMPNPSMNPTPTPTSKPQPPKVSTKLGDLLAFSGPAPERINGRLAMIGFVAALAVELSNGTDLLDQISNGGGVWFLGTSILFSAASLVPLLKGKRAEAKTDGLMNSNAEMLNGRLAMLGLVALALTELVKGGALV